jgi:hypothetical protein
LELDDRIALSLPGSARLTTPLNPPPCSYLRVNRALTGTFTRVRVSSSVRLEAANGAATDGVAIMLLMLQDGTRTVSIYITVGRDNSYVQEQFEGDAGPTDKIYKFPILSFGRWTNLDLKVTLPKTVAMQIDGETAVSFELAQPLAAKGTSLDFSVGAHCLSPQGHATDLRFDNVVLDTD